MKQPIQITVKGLKFTALGTLLCLGACNLQTSASVDRSDAAKIVQDLTYVMDARTKQCYALVASRRATELTSNGFTITWVPCTPEVQVLLSK